MGEPTSYNEQCEQMLREGYTIPPVLARVLDDLPDGWALLWTQVEINRLGAHPWNRFEARKVEGLLEDVRVPGDGDPWKYPALHAHGFDFEKGLVELPSTGGSPRSLYSHLVRKLRDALEVMDLPELEKPRQKQAHIRRMLRPFFPAKYVSKEKLRETWYNS